MSATAQPSATGMTAHAEMASPAVTIGASRNSPLFALAGIMNSLNTNFRRSAKDCHRPNGPTTFGPRRICTAAQIFRSARSTNAMKTSSTTITARLCATIRVVGHP